jgi:hypothetical protein
MWGWKSVVVTTSGFGLMFKAICAEKSGECRRRDRWKMSMKTTEMEPNASEAVNSASALFPTIYNSDQQNLNLMDPSKNRHRNFKSENIPQRGKSKKQTSTPLGTHQTNKHRFEGDEKRPQKMSEKKPRANRNNI